MPFTRLFKAKKPCYPSIPAERKTVQVDIVPMEWAQRKPNLVYRSGNKHQSFHAEVCIMEEESAPCASWRDEDNASVASDDSITTATSARGLIPTSDSWLCSEYPSQYYYLEDARQVEEESSVESEGESESEAQVSPMSSTETLVEVSPRAALAAAKIEVIARQVKPKAPARRVEATLIPLAVAQARADIKYRPEGFELAEEKQALKAKKAQVEVVKPKNAEAAWWTQI